MKCPHCSNNLVRLVKSLACMKCKELFTFPPEDDRPMDIKQMFDQALREFPDTKISVIGAGIGDILEFFERRKFYLMAKKVPK